MRIFLSITVTFIIFTGLSIYYFNLPEPVATTPPPLTPAELDKLPTDRKGQVLIYGAYGYTGAGISQLAADYGIRPVLAGRNESKLKPLADALGSYNTPSDGAHRRSPGAQRSQYERRVCRCHLRGDCTTFSEMSLRIYRPYCLCLTHTLYGCGG